MKKKNSWCADLGSSRWLCQTWLKTIWQLGGWERISRIKSTLCPVRCKRLQYFIILVFVTSLTHQRCISGFGKTMKIWLMVNCGCIRSCRKLNSYLPQTVSAIAGLWLMMSLLQDGSLPLYFVAVEIWILWLIACKLDGLVVRWLK